MSISEEKAGLRSEVRQARRLLSDEERRASALAVAERVLRLPLFEEGRPGTVLAYMPMKYELDILPAAERLKARGWRVAFPLCTEGNRLRLLIPAEENGFVPGAYGIMEPDVSTALEIDKSELAAVLLPAVAFDLSFNRLGQGGGYYDRLLADIRCFTAAVGFDCQLVGRVPTELTDRPVDAVVTPSWIGEASRLK